MDVTLTSRSSYTVRTLLSLPLLPASDIPDSKMQFLLAVSHSMGAHTESFRQRDEDSSSSSSSEEDAETEAPTATTESASADAAAADDCCEVCLLFGSTTRRLRFLWCHPCGHARFCETCAVRVADLSSGCTVCRIGISPG